MGKRSAVVGLLLGNMGSMQRETRPSMQREDQPTMATKLEQIAPSCVSPTGSCKHSQCCKSTAEEPGARNLHAGFCGNRGRATASGDPVGWETGRWPLAPSYRAHPRLYLT